LPVRRLPHTFPGMPRPRTYVSDLTHFLDERGQVIEGPLGKMGHYLGLIVEIGSVLPIGHGGLAPAHCASPRRRRCGGRLVVARPEAERIEWECQTCGENGVISHWIATRFNLVSVPRVAQADVSSDPVVQLDELSAMRRLGGAPPTLRRLLAEAGDLGEGYFTFSAGFAHLEELRDLAASAAERARGEDRRLLDRFAARMDAFRTASPDFLEPEESPLDLQAVQEGGVSPKMIALARQIAAERGHDDVMFDDLLDARAAWDRGRRPVLH
jgi:hypothetical protein